MVPSRACLAIALWCALATFAGAQTPAPADAPPVMAAITEYQGLSVREIQFQGIRGDERVMASLRKLVAQPLNEPLDRRKVSASLKALFETGRFADLQVEAQKTSPTEVTLIFVGKGNFFVRSVNADGAPRRPSAAQLVDMSKLQLGQLYSAEKVRDSIAAMKQALSDNGWYQATVTDAEQFHAGTQTVDIEFHVKRGSPAKIGQLIVQGTPGHTNAEIRSIAHLQEGKTVSADRLASALQRLRKKYSGEDRLEAQITVSNRVYHPENNTLDYVLRIDRGPTVEVAEDGATISHGQLRKLVPVYEEHAADEDLLNEGRMNIRNYLQTNGYFDATVDYHEQSDPRADNVHIQYAVERGVKHDLTDIILEGNKYFGSDLLRERMDIQAASWPLYPHGRFSQDMLDHDVQSIIALYQANGFEHVHATGEVKDDYQGVIGRMAVFVHIKEGPQTLVRNLQIVGNYSFPGDQLTTALANNATELYNVSGQPFSEDNIAKDRDGILNYYFNEGFPEVSFEAKVTAVDPTHEDVTYTIVEGRREYVDRIVTSGLHYTKQSVVNSQYTIHAGEPLSQVKMLDSQRHLYDLGVFNEVKMAVQNPEGDAQYKDLITQFQEARRWTLTYGLGVEIQSGFLGARTNPQGKAGASPMVSFDVSRINFGGRAHTLSLQSNVGSLQQRGLISYDAPRWYGYKSLRLTFTAFYDNSLDVRTFTSQRMEGAVQLEQVVSRATTLLYRFTYRRVRATNLIVDPSLIPLLSRPVRVGMPSFTYIRDHRDDPIDSHSGNYTTFDAGVAAGAFGSEAAFGRALIQNSTYTPFTKKKTVNTRRIVFARNTSIGSAEPFGKTSVIPLPERFFAGGGNTLRGFAINQAGPRDITSGFPLGGNALFINNLELRVPSPALPFVGDNLGFVIFEDAGNTFASTSKAASSLLRWHQLHPEQCKAAALAQLGNVPDVNGLQDACRFDYIAHAVGGGIRYRTPIGPVRFDLGYNLNPPVFPVLGIDPATGKVNAARYSQLGHFNFFFSIGQTF